MRNVVDRTRVGITAVIDRSQMHVADLDRLEVGGLFPLNDVTLNDVTLEIRAAGEIRTICRGRLGTFKRNKAVKLAEPPERAFLEPLAAALARKMPPEDAPERRSGDTA
jgi:flagellar motor switch protein FliM